jgi:hypothetical protein
MTGDVKKLHPCWFCGGAEFHYAEPIYESEAWVVCEKCGAGGPTSLSRRLAGIAWNRRVPEKPAHTHGQGAASVTVSGPTYRPVVPGKACDGFDGPVCGDWEYTSRHVPYVWRTVQSFGGYGRNDKYKYRVPVTGKGAA